MRLGEIAAMGCFGNVCATAASKQPVKRYNTLTWALFAQTAPAVSDTLDVAIVRKIGKIQEYVEENVQRTPKVSRRLHRRIIASLSSPSKHGDVMVCPFVNATIHCV